MLVVLYFLNLTRNETTAATDSYRSYTQLILTRHAKCRMDCRQITEKEIREIIEKGKLNRNKSGYNKQHQDSTFALEGYSFENQHIRVVVSPKDSKLVVITVIDLDKDWQCHCD